MATKFLALREVCQKLCRKPTGNHSRFLRNARQWVCLITKVFGEQHPKCNMGRTWCTAADAKKFPPQQTGHRRASESKQGSGSNRKQGSTCVWSNMVIFGLYNTNYRNAGENGWSESLWTYMYIASQDMFHSGDPNVNPFWVLNFPVLCQAALRIGCKDRHEIIFLWYV